MGEVLSACRPELHAALRQATAAAHAGLEAQLSLLAQPLEAPRFLAILQGFWGFHQVWERQLAAAPALAALVRERSRLEALAHDLAALGMARAAIAVLPVCTAAARLGDSDARGLGSLYVMEGSTLGGQVISRALADAPWLPEGGLRYFNPYGARTGAMWRATLAALDAAEGAAAQAELIAGALDTFALLQDWLRRGEILPRAAE